MNPSQTAGDIFEEDVMKHFNALPLLLITLIALAVVTGSLAGCGEAACPAGSQRVGGQCMPVLVCPDGEERDGNECVAVDAGADGGDGDGDPGDGDGDGDGDAGNPGDSGDDGGDPDASGSDAAAPDPLCADVDCGDHGECEVADDEARCACDNDHAGEHCEACEPGLGLLAGECVPGCEAEDAPECGDHGECDVVDDEAQCVCEHPFGEDDCEGCAEGYALQVNGTCEADCGNCGAHGYCDATPLVPECACFAGYADSGSGCQWVGDGTTGGILDGELNNPAAWGGEYVTIQDGRAHFDKHGTGSACELGVLEQTITMPTRADSEQFVLDLEVETPCLSTAEETCIPLQLEIGGSVTRVLIPGGDSEGERHRTVPVCLGDAAYGGDVDLRVRPGLFYYYASQSASCTTDQWPELISMQIRTASVGECPINTDVVSSSSKILAAIPKHEDFPGAAFTVLTPSSNVAIALDSLFLFQGTGGNLTLCVPDWAYGSVHTLSLPSGVTANDVELMQVSECGDGALRRSFEASAAMQGWFGSPPLTSSTLRHHTGNASWSANATAQIARAPLRFPVREGDQVPAFEFWREVGTSSMRGTFAITGPLSATGTFTDTSWDREHVCVPRAWAGQLVYFNLQLSAEMVGNPGTPIAYVDDAGPVLVSESVCPDP